MALCYFCANNEAAFQPQCVCEWELDGDWIRMGFEMSKSLSIYIFMPGPRILEHIYLL